MTSEQDMGSEAMWDCTFKHSISVHKMPKVLIRRTKTAWVEELQREAQVNV